MRSIHVPESGITFTLPVNGTREIKNDADSKSLSVIIPQSAMTGQNKGLDITARTFLSQRELPSYINGKVKIVGPIVELREDSDSEVKFADYIEIKVPHKMKLRDELQYTEVLRGDGENFRSLPTGLENQDNHEDAYFTVDENYVTIYTKTFSTYTCHKGHKNRLNINVWVYGFYPPHNKTLKIRVIISGSNPKQRMLKSRGLDPESIVLEENQSMTLPIKWSSYNAKDTNIVYFLLTKNESWNSLLKDVNVQKNLSDILECSTCIQREETPPKDVPPPDGAVFHLEQRRPDETVPAEFKGAIHVVFEPPEKMNQLRQALKEDSNTKRCIDTVKRDDLYGVTSLPLSISRVALLGLQAGNGIRESPDIEGENQSDTVEEKGFETLKSEHINALSKRITNIDDLRKLVIEGLHMEADVIEQQPNNQTITTVAFNVLKKWSQTQDNGQSAYFNLRKALQIADMKFFLDELPEPPTKKRKINT